MTERNTAAETAEFVVALIAEKLPACAWRSFRYAMARQFETFATEETAVAWLERS